MLKKIKILRFKSLFQMRMLCYVCVKFRNVNGFGNKILGSHYFK